MLKSNSKIIGITIGDPCGVGPEVISKVLRLKLFSKVRFVIVGSKSIFSKYRFPVYKNISYIHVSLADEKFIPGRPTLTSGFASLQYLKVAIDCIKRNEFQALVTGPVCKESIIHWEPRFRGHTEFLAEAFGVKRFEMMFVAPAMRVITLTRHVPLISVPSLIKQKKVYETIVLASEGLKKLFQIKNPRIALAGLNPHAGEGGKLGKEELKEIVPAINLAKKNGIHAVGPLAADTLFLSEKVRQFDCIIAMYHDQGLIPIKQLYFKTVVNFTLGLPFIRTSPAHGTAFDIAGKNKADPTSMQSAIQLACKLL